MFLTLSFGGFSASAVAGEVKVRAPAQQVLAVPKFESGRKELPTIKDMPHPDKDKFVTLTVENDMFGTKGTDDNYTSGVRLSYMDVGQELPRLSHFIDEYVPPFRLTENSAVFYSIGQNIYTPDDITQPR